MLTRVTRSCLAHDRAVIELANLRSAVAVLAISLVSWLARGLQSWPSRPLTMVVPFAAGGPMDAVARILATGLGEPLGQQVIIENVGGGGGLIGAARVAKAAPEGTVRARQCRHPRGRPNAVQ